MRRGAVAEAVQVAGERPGVHALLPGLGDQPLVAVLALGAGGDLHALPQQVEGLGDGRVVLRPQVVEGPDGGREAGDEHELVPGLLGDQRAQRPLALGVEVVLDALPVPAGGAEPGLGVGHGDAREGQLRDDDPGAEVFGDRLTVAFGHGGEHPVQHPLLEGHHVLDAVDPGDLDVDAGELGGVPRGERRLGPEHRPDLEDPVDAARDGHLLVELRRLGEVGGAPEVPDLEHLGPGLGGGAHQLGRVQLGEALLRGEFAHRPLDGRLDVEDEVLGRAPDVEEPPVQALVDAGLLVDRQLRLGERDDLDPGRDDLQTAELHLRAGDHLTGDLHGRLDRAAAVRGSSGWWCRWGRCRRRTGLPGRLRRRTTRGGGCLL